MQDSPDGGANLSGGGYNLLFAPFFLKTAWNEKKMDRGGGTSPAHTLRVTVWELAATMSLHGLMTTVEILRAINRDDETDKMLMVSEWVLNAVCDFRDVVG